MAREVTHVPLLDNVEINRTAALYTLSNGRRLSNYSMISIEPELNGYARLGTTIPVNRISNETSGRFSMLDKAGLSDVEFVIVYHSDTKLEIKFNTTDTSLTAHMTIDALVTA